MDKQERRGRLRPLAEMGILAAALSLAVIWLSARARQWGIMYYLSRRCPVLSMMRTKVRHLGTRMRKEVSL